MATLSDARTGVKNDEQWRRINWNPGAIVTKVQLGYKVPGKQAVLLPNFFIAYIDPSNGDMPRKYIPSDDDWTADDWEKAL